MANDPSYSEITSRYWSPAVFSKNVIEHTKSNLVVANAVNTEYPDNAYKGYICYIPVMTAASAAEVTAGTELTASDTTTTGTSITMDQWYGSRVETSEQIDAQTYINYLEKGAQSCAYAIAKQVDTALGALFSSLGGYSTSAYGSDGQTLTDDIILVLMTTLDEADVPEDERSIICDPSSKADLLTIDKFVRNDYIRGAPVATGQFGNIYNMKVLITNNLTAVTSGTGNYGCMLHRDALGLAMSKEPYSQMIPMPWEHQTVFQVKVIYGVGELRDSFGVPFYTRHA